MLNPQFCCCAIPLVNAGIYALLSEQFALAMLAGVLAISTPTIVGSFVPTYTPYILAAVSFLIAAVQMIGFYGVFKEQRRTYKTYAVLNTLLFACAFILAGALVGVSGARHSQAVDRCLEAYYGEGSTTTSEGKQVCDAFAWVDLGVMAGLWLLLFVVQSYLCFITRVYASNQKDEHQRYKSIYDANAEEFAMVEQMQRYGVPGHAWDHRMSLDSQAEREYPVQGYTSDAVVDAGGSYHQSHPDAQRGYPEEQGYPAQQGYAPPHPDEFASEAEYREYMQHMEDQQREAQGQGQQYPAQGYEDGASSPSGYSSSAAHQQPGYNAPPPGYAGDVPVRDEKYTYSR